jgi:hypothetical protein
MSASCTLSQIDVSYEVRLEESALGVVLDAWKAL